MEIARDVGEERITSDAVPSALVMIVVKVDLMLTVMIPATAHGMIAILGIADLANLPDEAHTVLVPRKRQLLGPSVFLLPSRFHLLVGLLPLQFVRCKVPPARLPES